MSRFWTELAASLTPYVPGEQPPGRDLIKLNTNECPYGPSPAVAEAIAAAAGDDLRRYPDPQSVALRTALGARYGLDMGQVYVGNGSDEVLALTFMALLKHDLPLYFADITYSFYPVWADLARVQVERVPLRDDLTVDLDAYPEACGGIIVCNPNAPTGQLLPLTDIEGLLTRCRDVVVVVDEAYIDFGGESAATLVNEYDNLLVVQTLSKSRALAGLRVGYAFGNAALIEGIDRVKNSFNSYPLDRLAQAAALAAVEDEAYFEDCTARVIANREGMATGLKEFGFDVLPSATNFLFVTHPQHEARELFGALRERGVIVRYFDAPRIDTYLRISVGDERECEALLAALKDILGA